jgi:hypothetical protein
MKTASGTKQSVQAIAAAAAQEKRLPSADAIAAEIKGSLGDGWLPRMYRERILPMRTRAHHLQLTAKGSPVEVQHTLLGIELKIGRRRMSCPDLATARYLAVFARAGCADVAVPYDITQISRLADDLEAAWHRMLLLIDHHGGARSSSFRSRLRTGVITDVRQEIEAAGAGSLIPHFNQSTRQRTAARVRE